MTSIKTIIFDLDGVLFDARDLHYRAMNEALRQIGDEFVISDDEHLSTYDGLPTRRKLQIASREKGLPRDVHDYVWRLKQEATQTFLDDTERDDRLCGIFSRLKSEGYLVYVCSNSIRKTVVSAVRGLGLSDMVDGILSNEDVNHPKPHPEMYLRTMVSSGSRPHEVIIFEDSHHGRRAAIESGGNLIPVKRPEDLTIDFVFSNIEKIKNGETEEVRVPWIDNELNVLIPMAGRGSRFEKAGYTFPKPLIEVNGKPMIQTVVESLNIKANFIFVVQKEHYDKYALEDVLNNIAPGCKIVQTEGVTEGAACTTLLAKEYINNDKPLLLANSDQYLSWESNEFMYQAVAGDLDGAILCFKATHPKWSFARTDRSGFVVEVAEKKPISDLATVGVYFWARGEDYVASAERMIEKDIRTNGEFYVCPAFNEAIEDGARIRAITIDRNQMWGLGTPEDLDTFLRREKT